MARCPSCKEEIDCLDNYSRGTVSYTFTADSKDNYDYSNEEFESDGTANNYVCPECGEIVATDHDKAVEILAEPKENFPIRK